MHLKFLAAGLLLGMVTGAVLADTAPPIRIRATIDAVEPQALALTTRDGSRIEVKLNDALTILTVKNVPLESIASNAYVGIATRSGAEGKPEAIEVLVFPESMRGAGEGNYSWDLESGSMMTNGSVTAVAQGVRGRELSVAYKGQSVDILVPPEAAVVTFVAAERADLKPGERVFLSATKGADGALTTGRVVVSKNGVAPPM